MPSHARDLILNVVFMRFRFSFKGGIILNMRKKIFVAISLPENIKDKIMLHVKSDDFALLPVRWIEKENLHLIVEFLGYVEDDQVYEIAQRLHEVTEGMSLFSLNFNKIGAGPLGEKPKMIWMTGDESKILKELNKKIIDAMSDIRLVKSGKKHNFIAHITLGMIEKSKLKDFEMKEKEVNMPFSVENIELMESFKEKNKTKYAILESVKF